MHNDKSAEREKQDKPDMAEVQSSTGGEESERKSESWSDTVDGLLVLQNEMRCNGQGIDWRYWVRNAPTLSAAEAARLMSALDPDIFADLERPERPWNSWHGTSSVIANIKISSATANAKIIQRLAERQGMLSATPDRWLEWADSNHLNVHNGFRLDVNEANEAKQAQTVETETVSPKVPQKGQTVRVKLERLAPKGGDSLTPVIWEICYDLHEAGTWPTPVPVMAELRIRADSADPKLKGPLLSSVAGGVKYEDASGDERELVSTRLQSRIHEWRQANTVG